MSSLNASERLPPRNSFDLASPEARRPDEVASVVGFLASP
jgi:hypothetical protein